MNVYSGILMVYPHSLRRPLLNEQGEMTGNEAPLAGKEELHYKSLWDHLATDKACGVQFDSLMSTVKYFL